MIIMSKNRRIIVQLSQGDPPRKYARFTTVPLKACLKYELDINFVVFKTDYFLLWVLYKSITRVSTAGKLIEIIRMKHLTG